MSVPIVMVAAVARNRVIGADNGLPWHMRSDLKHFKAATMGKPMIMGRKTYQSIVRTLPGRRTIVVTRDGSFAPEGVEIVGSLDAGIELGQAVAREMGADELIIAGGAAIYAQALPSADRLVLTELALDAEVEAFFPDLPSGEWREVRRVSYPRGDGDDAAFDVVTWERRA